MGRSNQVDSYTAASRLLKVPPKAVRLNSITFPSTLGTVIKKEDLGRHKVRVGIYGGKTVVYKPNEPLKSSTIKDIRVSNYEALASRLHQVALTDRIADVHGVYDDDDKRDGSISNMIQGYTPFYDLYVTKRIMDLIDDSEMFVLGQMLATAYLFAEEDLNLANIGFDKDGRIVRIDFDQCFFALSCHYANFKADEKIKYPVEYKNELVLDSKGQPKKDQNGRSVHRKIPIRFEEYPEPIHLHPLTSAVIDNFPLSDSIKLVHWLPKNLPLFRELFQGNREELEQFQHGAFYTFLLYAVMPESHLTDLIVDTISSEKEPFENEEKEGIEHYLKRRLNGLREALFDSVAFKTFYMENRDNIGDATGLLDQLREDIEHYNLHRLTLDADAKLIDMDELNDSIAAFNEELVDRYEPLNDDALNRFKVVFARHNGKKAFDDIIGLIDSNLSSKADKPRSPSQDLELRKCLNEGFDRLLKRAKSSLPASNLSIKHFLDEVEKRLKHETASDEALNRVMVLIEIQSHLDRIARNWNPFLWHRQNDKAQLLTELRDNIVRDASKPLGLILYEWEHEKRNEHSQETNLEVVKAHRNIFHWLFRFLQPADSKTRTQLFLERLDKLNSTPTDKASYLKMSEAYRASVLAPIKTVDETKTPSFFSL